MSAAEVTGRHVDRRARWWALGYAPVVAVYAALAVLVAPDVLASAVWSTSAVLFGLIGAVTWRVPPSTDVTAQGVRVRRCLYSRRMAWPDVADVDLPAALTTRPWGRGPASRTPRGRARLLTTSGRTVRLLAVPPDVAERIAVLVHQGTWVAAASGPPPGDPGQLVR